VYPEWFLCIGKYYPTAIPALPETLLTIAEVRQDPRIIGRLRDQPPQLLRSITEGTTLIP
jgi:hypothetical protein